MLKEKTEDFVKAVEGLARVSMMNILIISYNRLDFSILKSLQIMPTTKFSWRRLNHGTCEDNSFRAMDSC